MSIAGTWGVELRMFKPDGNFIVKTLTPSDGGVEIEFDEQMTAAPGVGYLDLKITPTSGDIITCHATVVVDTPVYNDEVIESVSMAYGLIFPDDFQRKLVAGSNITISDDLHPVISSTGGGGGGSSDYQDLSNKPKINNVILTGNKTTAELGLPTKTSDLTNDSGFITSAVNDLLNYYKKTEVYTKTEVNTLLSNLSTLNLEVVSVLPDHDISETTIYLLPKTTPGTDDVYDEYVYINNNWEVIGSTAADLSNYYNKTQTDTLLAGKVDMVTGKGLSTNDFTNADVTKLSGIEAGAEVNVQADWNQSDPDADDYIKNKPSIGVYSAGAGIDITSDVISIAQNVRTDIQNNISNIGLPAAYDNTATYVVGDESSYNGIWCTCVDDVLVAEDFDPLKWVSTNAYAKLTTLNSNLTALEKNDLGSGVDISSYTTTDNLYTCPSDGYILMNASSSTSTWVNAEIYGSTSNNSFVVSASNGRSGLFVRKGMRLRKSGSGGTSPYIYFYPLQ